MKEKKSSYFTATWKMLAAVLIGGIAGGVSVVIYELMKKGELKKVLLVPTGALLNKDSPLQKQSIPGIAHAVAIEV